MGNLFSIGDKFLTDVPLTVNGHLKDNNCPNILFKSSISKANEINQIYMKDKT